MILALTEKVLEIQTFSSDFPTHPNLWFFENVLTPPNSSAPHPTPPLITVERVQ